MQVELSAGKGDTYREVNTNKYTQNFAEAFGEKDLEEVKKCKKFKKIY